MKKEKKFTDDQIHTMILGPQANREKALRFAFVQWRAQAKRVLLSKGAQPADADDAIQDAIVIFDRHIREGRFYKSDASLKSYFIGICKGAVFSNKRKTKRLHFESELQQVDGLEKNQPVLLRQDDELKSILDELLRSLDEVCRKLLILYKLDHSYKEISDALGLGNPNNARQKGSKCRNKFRKILIKDKRIEDFKEEKND